MDMRLPTRIGPALAVALLSACGSGTSGDSTTDPEAVSSVSQATGTGSSSWVVSGGALPFDAVIGGTDDDGSPLYVCRAPFGNGIHLGKFHQGWTGCDIPYGGQEVTATYFQVLTPLWVAAHDGYIPPGAVQGGQEADGTPLYICRDRFNSNDLHPGKIRAGFPGCKIGYGGNEYDRLDYEVLMSHWASSWQDATNRQLPGANPFALIGGYETTGQPLYLCRAHYPDRTAGLTPGKFRSGFASCKVPYAGTEIDATNHYGTLYWDSVGPQYEGATNGAVPPTAVAQGYDNDGAPFYACRAYYGRGLHPGKIRTGWNGCDIGYGGKEVTVSSYGVLVEP
jgi:hypothetical protein